jgi:hypothetical protein
VILLKEWECEEVKNHKDIGKTIMQRQEKGWHLQFYQTSPWSGGYGGSGTHHYLLFEKGT